MDDPQKKEREQDIEKFSTIIFHPCASLCTEMSQTVHKHKQIWAVCMSIKAQLVQATSVVGMAMLWVSVLLLKVQET